MEKVDKIDFVHTGPGTLAGRYLRKFWQPVFRAQDLSPGQVVPVLIMNERFSLYRGEGGTAHLMAPQCPHRKAPMFVGLVEGDSLRCMYHGWKFDGSGQCVEQPGEDESFARNVEIRTYPTFEYLGLIFAFLGEGEAPPFRHYLDLEEPGVIEVCSPECWPCNYFNRLDNACDFAHVAFTHREAITRADRPDMLRVRPPITVEETEYGIRTSHDAIHFHMPNTNLVRARVRVEGSLHDAATLNVSRLSWRVPMDDENTISFSIDLLPLVGEEAKRYRERRKDTLELAKAFPPTEMAEAILAGKLREKDLDKRLSTATLFSVEDYLMQVGQGKVDRSTDRLGRMDVGVFLMRKIWERELRTLADDRPIKRWTTSRKVLGNGIRI